MYKAHIHLLQQGINKTKVKQQCSCREAQHSTATQHRAGGHRSLIPYSHLTYASRTLFRNRRIEMFYLSCYGRPRRPAHVLT